MSPVWRRVSNVCVLGVLVRKLLSAAVAALTLTVASPAFAAPTLVVDSGGTLTGVTSLNISGTLYDVTLVEGSCATVFGTCTAASFGLNGDSTLALAAAQALYAAILGSTFDALPQNIAGCSSLTACQIFIPYGITQTGTSFMTAIYLDWSATSGGNDVAALTSAQPIASFNTATQTNNSEVVFGKLSLSAVAPVPESATWAMMLLGFGGIGFAMRRKHKAVLSQPA